jgi:hypothetical protein
MRGVFQATIVDDAGNVVPECIIEVRDETSGDLVQLYDAFDAGSLLGNPVDADSDGFIRFYAESALYRIDATSGAFSRTWRHVVLGTGSYSAYGTYTPAATAVANCSGLVPVQHRYQRAGTIVTVSGSVALSATSGSSVSTSFTVALPIASDFTTTAQAHGSGANNTNNGAPAFIISDVTSNRLLVTFYSTVSGSQVVYYTAQYEII